MRPTLSLLACLVVAGAFAQEDFSGRDQFSQFRNLGGLSGNLVPISPDGAPSYLGALSLSTPVAYTLSNWHGVAAYGSLSFDMSLKFPSGRDNQKETNSTGQFMLGTSLGEGGSFMASYMVLSHLGDGAFNFQWAPMRQTNKLRWAVGVQDIRGGGGASKDGAVGDSESSTSLYGVATYAIDEKTHVSFGTGTRRFKGAFGNISTSIAPNLKAMVEYDAYNWNVGVAYRVAVLQHVHGESYETSAQTVDLHTFLGVVRGKFLFWGVGISF